ncbi:phage tail tape measure protein [Alistipes sp.]|uniref:phage tail tape measure protein n=1 Tax=Alistipes sp. TaxID=1872444 RepID=UPI00284034E6|nr:phage tail tape measure protein [Alistipes sp.]MDR3834574.1 phage tail tape measure protein [Alistipes sp.]
MAQNEIHKIITIEFKNSELIDKMREAQNAIKALNTETKYLKEDLNEYRQQLKSGAISQDQFDRMMIKTKNEIIKNDQAVIKYKSDIKAYTRELQSNIRQDKEKIGSLNQLRSSVKSLTAEYNNLSAAERGGVRGKEIVRQIQKTTAEIARQENALRNYHIGVGNYAGGIQKAFVKIGAAWMAIRSAFSLFRNSFNTIKDFEQANTNLGTILGATKEEMDKLRESALELGRTTEYTASQVTQLQTELAKLGFGPESIQAMQQPILNFATAVGAKLPDAAKLAGATLRIFGLSAHQTEDALDVLALSTNKSALSFEYLNTALSIVGPVAKTFGFSVRDVTALLGSLANSGFDASSAATATRNILLNLADTNGKLAKSLNGPVKSLPELIDGLKKLHARGIDLAGTLELTDKRSVAAFNTFLNGADDVKELHDALQDVDGAAKSIAEERLNTVEGSIKLLQSAWEGLVLSFYNSKGTIKSVIDILTNGIEGISNLLNPDAQKNKQKNLFLDEFMNVYSSEGEDALNRNIQIGLKYWGDQYEEARKRYAGSGGLFGKSEFDITETMYKAFIAAGNEALDNVQKLKKEQEDLAAQTEDNGEKITTITEKELKARQQAARTQLDLEKQLSKSILELRQASLEKDLELSRLRFSWERQELENKLKYDKTLTAESREAINKLILNMEERRYKEESEIRQRWSDKELEEEARNAENRIKMRFNAQNKLQTIRQKEAQLPNYDILHTSDPNKDIEKNAAKMDIAQQQMDAAQNKLSEIQSMSEETYTALYGGVLEWRNAELDAQKAVAEAKQQVNDIQLQGIKLQEKETQMSIQSAQQMVGALEELAEAAGADAGVVAMLAIAESAAAMGSALHKAFSSSATVWDGIAGAVAAIATITTIITQIKSLNSSAEEERSKYRYASGGLVTGPGTGTSDSIPAMLSNGEAVMTAQAVNDWGAMLSAMNVASGGNAIQVSNLPQRNDGMKGMKAMIREAMLEMPAPRVAVVDIIKGEKRVKVQNSLGKLGRKKYE